MIQIRSLIDKRIKFVAKDDTQAFELLLLDGQIDAMVEENENRVRKLEKLLSIISKGLYSSDYIKAREKAKYIHNFQTKIQNFKSEHERAIKGEKLPT